MIREPFTRTSDQEAELGHAIADALADLGDTVINPDETSRWSAGLELRDGSAVERAEATPAAMAKAVVEGKATFYEFGAIGQVIQAFKCKRKIPGAYLESWMDSIGTRQRILTSGVGQGKVAADFGALPGDDFAINRPNASYGDGRNLITSTAVLPLGLEKCFGADIEPFNLMWASDQPDGEHVAPTPGFKSSQLKTLGDHFPLTRVASVLLIAGDTLDGLLESKEVSAQYFNQRHFNKLLKLSGHVLDCIPDEFLTHFKSSEQGSMGLMTQFGKQCIFLKMPQSSNANACYMSSWVHRNGDYLVMSAVLAVFTYMVTGQTGLGREDMPLHLVHTRQDDEINAIIGSNDQIYIAIFLSRWND